MAGRLAGKVALVTGAGQGIGQGTALALARESAAVGLAGRRAAALEKVAAQIQELGGKALVVTCDVAERAQVDRAVAVVGEHFGGLDILVNNAQSSTQQPVEAITDADIELSWRSGTLGTLYAMQAALPLLRARGGGCVVNFGSSTGMDGDPMFGAYAMAKEAIRGLSRVAAREWGRYGIRVNVVVPIALSPAAEQYARDHPERFAAVAEGLPLGRMGDPEQDIGRAIVSLVSDDLAYLTGQTLRLTGGG